MRKLAAVVGLTTILIVVGASCSDDESSSPATTTATTATTAAAERSFEVRTDDGQVSLSLDGELPPGWPESFPVPDGAEAAGSGSLGGTGSTGMVGVFRSSGSPQSVYDFYTSDAGLTVESQGSLGNGDSFVGTVRIGGSTPALITIVPNQGATLIIVALESPGSGTTVATTSN